MRRFRWGILALLLIGLIFFGYYFYQRQQAKQSTGLVYNPFSQTWEPGATQQDNLERETILKHASAENSAAYNPSLLRGFFDSYDSANSTLTIKSLVAFSQNNLYEPLELSLSPSQTIYCSPRDYTDPNTGLSYPVEKLLVPVEPDQMLFLPNEQSISFDHFLEQSSDRTYLLIQLTSDLDKTNKNYIQKIIAIGLCD